MQNRRNAIYTLATLSLLIGLFTGQAIFFNLAYLFIGLILVAFIWAWLAVRGVAIGRMTRARRSQVGRKFSEAFSVHNTSYLPKLWLEVRDFSDLPGHQASQVVPSLAGRAKYSWSVETICVVRGEFRVGPITIISGDPFGFFLQPRRISATERIIVYPRIVPINQFHLPMGMLSGGEAQRKFTHHITTNAAGVRDYVTGDSMSRVHWKSTARRDRLMVKEFELDPMVDIWMFVDLSALSLVEDPTIQRVAGTGTIIPGTQEIPPSTEEYTVIAAASLAKHFVEQDRALGFAMYAPQRNMLQPERGNRQLNRILQSLAIARSQSPYSLKETLSLETPNLTRGATLIIVTASLDPAWVAEAQILARRGIRPMCVLIDPQSFGGGISSDEVRGMLQLAKIPTVIIRKGDDLRAALEQRPI